MKVFVQSELPCSPARAWDEVQTSDVLREIAWPLIQLRAGGPDGIPDRWEEGSTVMLRPYLFGLIPVGVRALTWERIDERTGEMQTREDDPLIHRWDHLIRVESGPDGRTVYTDEVEVEAGWLTLPVWLFAQWFYRHRQRRWQAVARRLAACQA